MNGCSFATSSSALSSPGKLSTSVWTPLRTAFIASLSYADFRGDIAFCVVVTSVSMRETKPPTVPLRTE